MQLHGQVGLYTFLLLSPFMFPRLFMTLFVIYIYRYTILQIIQFFFVDSCQNIYNFIIS